MPLPMFILSIEDDADDVDLLKEAFIDNGVEIEMEVVKSGDKAISHLEKGKKLPDVIVMDLNLPKLHGKEILMQLKSHPKFKNIPLVILTTSSAKEDSKFCLENGADTFITKPATVEGFNRAVRQIIATAKK